MFYADRLQRLKNDRRSRDEYYQEKSRPPRITSNGDLLRDTPKYDIDE